MHTCYKIYGYFEFPFFSYHLSSVEHNATLTTQNSGNLFSFNQYFIRIAKLYICIVLANIRYIFVNILIVNLTTLTPRLARHGQFWKKIITIQTYIWFKWHICWNSELTSTGSLLNWSCTIYVIINCKWVIGIVDAVLFQLPFVIRFFPSRVHLVFLEYWSCQILKSLQYDKIMFISDVIFDMISKTLQLYWWMYLRALFHARAGTWGGSPTFFLTWKNQKSLAAS